MTLDPKDIFIGRARKYNHFQDGSEPNPAHTCRNCIRKQFSYPYTCEDGWEHYRAFQEARGNVCINWTDQSNAPVD